MDTNKLKIPYLLVTAVAVYWVFLCDKAPPADQSYTMSFVQELFLHPEKCNPILTAVFNCLLLYPPIFASLLLPGARDQPVPALLFIYASYRYGFYILGFYLGLRKLRVRVTVKDVQVTTGLYEDKILPVLLMAFAIFTVYNLVNGILNDKNVVSEYISLFKTRQFCQGSTIDGTILTLVIWDAMGEDMQRRAWKGPPSILVSLFPIFGPIIYLFMRPQLPLTLPE